MTGKNPSAHVSCFSALLVTALLVAGGTNVHCARLVSYAKEIVEQIVCELLKEEGGRVEWAAGAGAAVYGQRG